MKKAPKYLSTHYVELSLYKNAFSDTDTNPHLAYVDKVTSKIIIVTHNTREFDCSKISVHRRNVVALDQYNRPWREEKNTLALRKLTAKEMSKLKKLRPAASTQRMFISKSLIRDLT